MLCPNELLLAVFIGCLVLLLVYFSAPRSANADERPPVSGKQYMAMFVITVLITYLLLVYVTTTFKPTTMRGGDADAGFDESAVLQQLMQHVDLSEPVF